MSTFFMQENGALGVSTVSKVSNQIYENLCTGQNGRCWGGGYGSRTILLLKSSDPVPTLVHAATGLNIYHWYSLLSARGGTALPMVRLSTEKYIFPTTSVVQDSR